MHQLQVSMRLVIDLDHWPWTFVGLVSCECDQSPYQIWAKSNNRNEWVIDDWTTSLRQASLNEKILRGIAEDGKPREHSLSGVGLLKQEKDRSDIDGGLKMKLLCLLMCIVEQMARYGKYWASIIGDASHEQRLPLSTVPRSCAVDLISHAAAHAPVVLAYQHAALPDLVTSFASSCWAKYSVRQRYRNDKLSTRRFSALSLQSTVASLLDVVCSAHCYSSYGSCIAEPAQLTS